MRVLSKVAADDVGFFRRLLGRSEMSVDRDSRDGIYKQRNVCAFLLKGHCAYMGLKMRGACVLSKGVLLVHAAS